MIVHYGESSFTCEKAVKTDSEVMLYDANNHEILRISNIHGNEWNHISVEDGTWSDIGTLPSEIETLRAKVDYCLMLLDV